MQRSCITNEDKEQRNCVNTPAYYYSNGKLDHWRWLESADFFDGSMNMSESPRLGAPALGQINGFVGDIGYVRKKNTWDKRPPSTRGSVIVTCVYDESGVFLSTVNLGTSGTAALNPGLTKDSSGKLKWGRDHTLETSTRAPSWTLNTDLFTVSNEDRYAGFFTFYVRFEDADLSGICAETFEP